MNSNKLMKFAGYGVFVGKIEEIMKYATETLPGIIEIATQAEVDAGVDDTRAITPKKQKIFIDAAIAAIPVIPDASESEAGKIELATQAEVDAGVDDLRAVTPLKQKTFVDAKIAAIPAASETQAGKAEIATQVETNAGTDNVRIVTPLKLKNYSGFPSVIGYALNGHIKGFDPADGQNYCLTGDEETPGTAFGNLGKIYIPKAGTVKACTVMWQANGMAGTNESISCYVRLNNSSDTLIASVSSTSQQKLFANYALNIAVATGNYIEIKLSTPTWATNPATVAINWVIYIE
jgi:hypothetical protein